MEQKTEAIVNVTNNVSNDFSDVFINENDTFDIVLRYYKKDGKIYVDGMDEKFSSEELCKEIVLTLKYPDQSDCTMIGLSSPKISQESEKIDIRDFLSMELNRLIILMRKWSINKKLDRDNIMSLNTKIVKGFILKIREKIGMDGIL